MPIKIIKIAPHDQERDLVRSLSYRRLLSRVSQSDLAAAMKTTQSIISRFERGKHHPSLNFILRYAAAIDVEVEIKLS